MSAHWEEQALREGNRADRAETEIERLQWELWLVQQQIEDDEGGGQIQGWWALALFVLLPLGFFIIGYIHGRWFL